MKPSSIWGRPGRCRLRRRGAYTLLELLVVVALLGIVAGITLPAAFHSMRKSPIRQAMSDLAEACQNARMMAILQGVTTELVVSATDGTLTVRPVQDQPAEKVDPGGAASPPAAADGNPDAPAPSRDNIKIFTVKLPESVTFKKLVANLQDMMDYEEARVRFYPNSTCDAFTATLLSEQNEERSITLEVTTGREEVEVIR